MKSKVNLILVGIVLVTIATLSSIALAESTIDSEGFSCGIYDTSMNQEIPEDQQDMTPLEHLKFRTALVKREVLTPETSTDIVIEDDSLVKALDLLITLENDHRFYLLLRKNAFTGQSELEIQRWEESTPDSSGFVLSSSGSASGVVSMYDSENDLYLICAPNSLDLF